MNKILLVSIIIIAGLLSVAAQTKPTALSVLTANEPGVKWNAKSEIKGDFDYDGVTDYALRGRRGKFFVLGIVKGALSGKSKHWTMQFGEDALCSVSSAVITVENLDKDYAEFAADYLSSDIVKALKNLPKNSKGINISDGQCDSFSILWNKKENQFFWWRI